MDNKVKLEDNLRSEDTAVTMVAIEDITYKKEAIREGINYDPNSLLTSNIEN